MTIAITGLGLIGGSLALSLRGSGFAQRLIGVESSPEHAAEALDLGLVDEVLPLDEAIAACELLILAAPVDALTQLLPQVLDSISEQQVVTDVGSTKLPLLAAVEGHPRRSRYVAAHPMAGTEYSGPSAAVAGLFSGKCCVLCETERSDEDAVRSVSALYESLGMRLATLDGQSHDLHTAYVSHISHIASFALALTVLEKEKEEARIFDLASGGFSSTVRLAKSNADTWTPIFRQNRDNVLDVLDEFINSVSRFRTLLIKKDFQRIHELIVHANDIRKIIG